MRQKEVSKFSGRIIVGILVSIFIGNFLDKKFHTSPLFLIVLILYVVIGSLYLLIKEVNNENKK